MGHHPGLDPRLNAFRPDLADRRLEGQVDARRFAAGEPARVIVGQAPLRRAPGEDSPKDSELLFGEAVTVFDRRDGWAWVQAAQDRYVGYLAEAALAGGETEATHQVAALRTFRFSRPDIKSAPLDQLSLGSPLAVRDEANRFLELADGGFVYAPHAELAGAVHADYVATAERFLAVPYLWGGRSSLGLDCSGLVQTALRLAGRTCPRDTYMQRDDAAVGPEAPLDRPLERGDLVYSPGHVAIATGAETLLHANAYHLAVAHETLAAFRRRLKAAGQAIDRVRRPPPMPAMQPHGIELAG